MKTGIIVDMNEHVLTLLTPEGEFLQARKQNIPYQLGQEIHFIPMQSGKRKRPFLLSLLDSFKGKSIAIAAIAFIIAVVSFFPIYSTNEVYAYMSIDINPSLELGVNENLQVIKIIPYNESGKKIIEQLDDWKRKDIDTVLKSILLEVKQEGYLGMQKEVVIGTVHTGKVIDTAEKKLEEALEKMEETILAEKTDIVVNEATTKEREQAQESGITAGKFIEEKQDVIKKNGQEAPTSKEKNPKVPKEKSQTGVDPNTEQDTPGKQKSDKKQPPGQAKKDEQQDKLQPDKKAQKTDKRDNQNSTKQQDKNLPPGIEKKVESNSKASQTKNNNVNNNAPSNKGKENSQKNK